MIAFHSLTCDDEARREALLGHAVLNGVDYIEVVAWPQLSYPLTADPLNDELTAEGSRFTDGHPVKLITDGALPAPLDARAIYYVGNISGENFQVAEAPGEPPLDITGSGSGNHVVDPLNQRVLNVYFLEKASLQMLLNELDGNLDAVKIEGGVRTRNIKVIAVSRIGDHLQVLVDRPGDFSTYTLIIDHASLDLPYKQIDFNFKIGCPSRFDCKQEVVCPIEPLRAPPIDYMAKDYASLRRALVDLIPTLAPHWEERLEADLGIALLELLAYVGDYLSYYQDAVANESWLETARQRVSVRRHARLIDYRMHDGASAQVAVFVRAGTPGRLPEGTRILSRIDAPLEARLPPHPAPLRPELAEAAIAAAGVVFETLPRNPERDDEEQGVYLDPQLNTMQIYPWGNRQCCIPRGATSVDLVGDLASVIQRDVLDRGSGLLLLEEVKSPVTGLTEDADPRHRQIVRVMRPELLEDSLHDPPLVLTRISWSAADGLSFPLCVSSRKADGSDVENVSVVRGNLVLADHGRTLKSEIHDGPRKPRHNSQRRAHQVRLHEGPLSFRIPLPQNNGEPAPAAALENRDPRRAEPEVTVTIAGTKWRAPANLTLLDSSRFDRRFAVETDNHGRATLRFGDDRFGMAPPDGEKITVVYRVGMGLAGNVGRDALKHVLNPGTTADWPAIDEVTNPLAASGGAEPELIEQVKQLAPSSFHARQFRAVTEADYAEVAQRHPDVDHAVATFRWTGSWHTVFISIDPRGRAGLSDEQAAHIHDFIAGFAQTGYDLEIAPPMYVPLDIEVDICVDRGHFRGDVEQELLRVLSSHQFPDGVRGLFHPDNFTFDQPFYLSQLFSTIESVEGVDSAVVRRFIRQDEHDPEPNRPATRTNLDLGYIRVGRLEIVRLDNDPNFLENGSLTLNMLGGK